MSGRHVVEMNLVAFLFAMALYLFLRVVNRGEDRQRTAYVQMLFAGGLVALAEMMLGVMLNEGLNRDIPFPLSMLCFILLDIAECTESIFFVRYIADRARNAQTVKKRITLPVVCLFSLYLVFQILNFFTGIAFHTTASGRLVAGPLMWIVVYGAPGIFLFSGVVLYILTVRGDGFMRRASVLSSVLFPLTAAFIQITLLPQLMMIGFSVVFSSFLIFFVFETPPYKQLNEHLEQLQVATGHAQKVQEEALAEDRAMNDFLANMSHEIRTPLTAILGYDEVILNGAAEKDVRDYAQDILNAGHTLLYIINDILDFSRIESGETTLTKADYHLPEVLDNVENMIRKKARDKGLEYRADIDRSIPEHLNGDSVRVNQILLNLLNNAVKYTEKGQVELKLTQEKDADDPDRIILRARISDTGIGIREEDLSRIFESFTRLDIQKNRGVEGTGLGLPITARLLKLMGGTIDIESRYGEGSVFTVTIPQTVIGKRTLEEYEAWHATRKTTGSQLLAPDARILIVDDNETNRTVVGELLKPTLVTIDMADSGTAALEQVREHIYDLILLDQMMPNMSGPETLQRMRAMEDNVSRGVPVIAFTADAIAGVRERLLNEGFDDYLAKPVTAQDLTGMMRRHIRREHLLLPGDAGYEESLQKGMPKSGSKNAEQELLERLQGIDLTQALEVCGTKEVLLAAVRDFYLTIDQQSALIERYLVEDDLPNYTIKVHALKSAARFIGARKLSEDAARLEECGNKKDTGTIRMETAALLALYRSYKEKLSAINPDAGRDDETKEEIDAAFLSEAYEELRQFVEEYDFDGADAVMESLGAYRIPEAERAHFEEVRLAVTNVNREALLKLL